MLSEESSGYNQTKPVPTLGRAYAFATVLFTALILFFSLPFMYSPYWTTYYNLGGPVYFFILLQVINLGPFPLILVMAFMMALYILFFTFMLKASAKPTTRTVDSPAGFFSIVIPAVFIITVIVTLIEQAIGVGIGGSSISNDLLDSPFQAYYSLIYAPFAEEIGFRIIPLGLFTFLLVYLRSKNLRDSLYSFIAPGRMRKKYDLKLGWLYIVLIIATSLIWGYAHVYFGSWDIGKIATVTITGIALAVGYLKFGVYVDIPMHWFFNGALTLMILYPPALVPVVVYTYWMLIAGIGGIVMLFVYLVEYLVRPTRPKKSVTE